MAININGLPTLSGPRTFVSGGPPIVLGNEVRGGIHRISGNTGDQLMDVDTRYLQVGMLVYNEMTSQYFMYRNDPDATTPTTNPDSNDPFRDNEGQLPNNAGTVAIGSERSNWIEFRLSPEVLNDIGNVNITNIQDGEVLQWDGTNNQWINAEDDVINALGNIGDVYLTTPLTPGQVLEYSEDINNPSDPSTPLSGWTNATDTTLERLEDLQNVTYGTGPNAPALGQVLEISNIDPVTGAVSWTNALDNPLNENLNGLTDVTITSPVEGQVLRYNNTNSMWENFTLALQNLSNVADAVSTAEDDSFFVFDEDNGWIARPRAVPSTPADQLRIFSPGSTTEFEAAHFLYELRVDIDRAGNRSVSWMETPGTVDLTIQQRPMIPPGATSFRTGDNIYHLIGFTGEENETVNEIPTGFFQGLGPLIWGIPIDTPQGRTAYGAQPALWFLGTRPTDTASQFAQSEFSGTTFHVTINYEGATTTQTGVAPPVTQNERADAAVDLAPLRDAIPPGQYTFEANVAASTSNIFVGNLWYISATQLRDQNGVVYQVPQPPRATYAFGQAFTPEGATEPTITANTSILRTTEQADLLPNDPIFVFQHGGTVDEISIEGSDYINVTRADATADIPYERVQTSIRGTQGIQAVNPSSDGTTTVPVANSNTSGGRASGLPGNNHFPIIRAGTGIELSSSDQTPDEVIITNTFSELDADTSQVTVDGSVPRGANDEFVQVFVRGAADRANQYYTERSGAVQYNFRAGDDVAFSVTGLRFDVETLAGGTNPFAVDELVAFSVVNALSGIPSLPVGDYSARVAAASSISSPAGAGTVSWTVGLLDIKTESGFNVVLPETQETQAAGSFNNGDVFIYEIAVNTATDDNDPFISLVHSQVDQNSSIRLRSTDQVIAERTGLGEISIRGNLADNIGADRQDDRLISSGQASQALNHLHDAIQQEVRDQRLEDHRGVQPVRSSGSPAPITENQRNIAESSYFHYRTDARTGLDRATTTSFEFRVVDGDANNPTKGVILLYLESPAGTPFADNGARLVAFSDWTANANVEYINEHNAVIWRATTSYIGDGGTINVTGTNVDVAQVRSPEEAVIVLEVDARDLDVFTQDRGTWVQSDESALDGTNHLNRFFFTGVPSAFRAARTYLARLNTITPEMDLSNVVYVKTDDSTSPMYEWEARQISTSTDGRTDTTDLLDRSAIDAAIQSESITARDRRTLAAILPDPADNEIDTVIMNNSFSIGTENAEDARTEANVGIEYTSAPDENVAFVTLAGLRFEIDTPVQSPGITRGDRLILRVGRTPNAPHDTDLPAGDYVVLAAVDVASGDTTIDIQDSFSRIDPVTRTHPSTTFQIADQPIVNGSVRLFAYQEDTIPAVPAALTITTADSSVYRFENDNLTLDGVSFLPDTGGTLTATSNMPAFASELVADTQYEITVVTHGATAESTISVNLLGLSPTLTPTTVPAGDSIRTLSFSWNAPTIIELENAAGSNNLYTHENGFRLTTSGGDLPDRIQIAHQGDSSAVPFRFLGSASGDANGVRNDTGIEEVVVTYSDTAELAGYSTGVAAGTGNIDAVATFNVPNQFGLITTDTGTVTPTTPRDTLTLSGTDITVNGSGTTAQFSQALFTRKTDLFLGTEGMSDTLMSPVVSITWTQYTTADVHYFFLEGISFNTSGSIVSGGDGVWTTVTPIGQTDADAYVAMLNTTNSANLIG